MVAPQWPLLPLYPPPAGLVVPAPTSDALSDGASLADTLRRMEELLTLGIVTREDLVKGLLLSPSITVGTETNFELQFKDLRDNPVNFIHLSITEVDIAAPQLVNADDVRLRLFRDGRRRVPLDLVAEFSGTSAVSGTWQSGFSNRRIEYTDLTGESKLYIAIRNTSGNSGPSTFEVLVYARVFRVPAS